VKRGRAEGGRDEAKEMETEATMEMDEVDIDIEYGQSTKSKQTYETTQIIRTFFTCIKYHIISTHYLHNKSDDSVDLCRSYRTREDGAV